MALTPADFAAYSRATGTSYPESPEERAQMAPEVRAFRQNQLQAPQQQESNSLALGLGIGLGLAGVGGGLMALRGRAKKPPKKDVAGKSSAKMTDLSDQPVPKSKTAVYADVAAKAEEDLPQVTRPSGGIDESMLITDPETGEVYRRGGQSFTRKETAQEVSTEQTPQSFLERYQERNQPAAMAAVEQYRQMTGADPYKEAPKKGLLKTQEDTRQRIEDLGNIVLADLQNDAALEKQASTVINELRQEPATLVTSQENRLPIVQETPTLTETYEAFGEPAARVQNIDAVDTASDQLDSRFESTVQRDVDSVFEGKTAVAAEKLGVYGPLTAQETADQALANMIQLRQDLYNQSTQPNTIRTKSGKLRIVPVNTVRAERALAERFKTGETTKLGDLGVTGKSLEQVTLPSGPMRQTVQSVETSQSPTFFSRSVANIGEDPFSSIDTAASNTSIRGRSRIQNEPEQFRQRVDSSSRRIDDEFGVELTELDIDTGEPRYSRKVMDSATGKLTSEFAPKGQRVVQLYQGEGQPTKSMYIPESDPGGIGIYGEERSFAAGPVSKFGENLGEYTKTAQRKPTDLPYLQKKKGDLTDMSTTQLETFASNAVKKNPRAAQAAMSELERREVSKRSMQASEAVRRANIEGRDPQTVLRSMGFGV
jgi:hypothetical protein